MRVRKKELDVDFIGGTRSLTKEDEKTISEFLKASKVKKQKVGIVKAKKSTTNNAE